MHPAFVVTRYHNAWCKCMLRGAVTFMLLTFSIVAKSQSATYSYTPADSMFTMEVLRGKNEVTISITFNDSLIFDYASIERKADFTPDFSQCGYISYTEIKTKGRHVVKKDIYAYPASSDVQYRLRFTSKDGAERTYPPLSLPAIK